MRLLMDSSEYCDDGDVTAYEIQYADICDYIKLSSLTKESKFIDFISHDGKSRICAIRFISYSTNIQEEDTIWFVTDRAKAISILKSMVSTGYVDITAYPSQVIINPDLDDEQVVRDIINRVD